VSETIDKIKSRGYWDVSIHPVSFVRDRLAYEDLEQLLTRQTVRLRGWPVPYIDFREEVLRGDDWIGQDIDAEIVAHYEAWRFFTTGQFNQLRSVSADWREGNEATAVPSGFSSVIEVWEILFYVTEVFELAARLALTDAGDQRMTVDVRLAGLTDRALVVGQQNRAPFVRPHRTTMPSIERTATMTRDDLVANPRLHAAQLSREIFLRFGWNPPLEQLSAHQAELDRP
jgi:hypothetical protein